MDEILTIDSLKDRHFSRQCFGCQHFQFPYRCAAFPDEIPDEIWFEQFDHTQPYPGDQGTQHKPMPVDLDQPAPKFLYLTAKPTRAKERRGIPRFRLRRLKHLPGQHDQSTHGSWAHGPASRSARPVVTAGQLGFEDLLALPVAREAEPAGTKISAKLDYRGLKSKELEASVQEALQAIDSVNGDGELSRIQVRESRSEQTPGQYHYQLRRYPNGKVELLNMEIRISKNSDAPALDFVHEVGHFIDHQGGRFGPDKYQFDEFAFAFPYNPPKDRPIELIQAADNLLEAIKGSNAYKTLHKLWSGPDGIIAKNAGAEKVFTIDKRHIRYLVKPLELFARSYAQYVAVRSRNPTLLRDLSTVRYRSTRSTDKDWITESGFNISLGYPSQWDDADFEPIAAAMDGYMEALGWRQ